MSVPLSRPCAWYRVELPGYLTGELEAAANDAVRAHVEICADCRRELIELRAIDRLLMAERASRRSVDAFQASFLDRFDREREGTKSAGPSVSTFHAEERSSRRSRMMTLVPVALAAGIAGLMLGVWTGPLPLGPAPEAIVASEAASVTPTAVGSPEVSPTGMEVVVAPSASVDSVLTKPVGSELAVEEPAQYVIVDEKVPAAGVEAPET